jgi:hypothetical protein
MFVRGWNVLVINRTDAEVRSVERNVGYAQYRMAFRQRRSRTHCSDSGGGGFLARDQGPRRISQLTLPV